jgi:hypothetical protein
MQISVIGGIGKTYSAFSNSQGRAVGRPPHEPMEHPTTNDCPTRAYWVFDVGCWMFWSHRYRSATKPQPEAGGINR